MKKILIINLFTFAVLSSIGQKHMDYDFFPNETDVKTIKFQVLDINFEKKLVAYKHVYELLPQSTFSSGEEVQYIPVDCKYAGMEVYPKAGVVLGIYDLEKEEYLKTFIIYESCMDIKECYEHTYSEDQLNAAKKLFSDYELNIKNIPKALLFKKKSDKEKYLMTDGITFSSTFVNDYDNMLTKSFLYVDGELMYYVSHDDNFAMASHGQIYHKAAYKKGNKIIFLSKFFHDNNMEGPRSYEFHYFSPVFEIIDGKVKKAD